MVMELTENIVWDALNEVMDPEIPVLSVVDLGIITSVRINDKSLFVNVTPTFAGCPAIKHIENAIKERLLALPFEHVEVKTTFDITWNSDMISDKGREILKNFGLAPPKRHCGNISIESLKNTICPYCGSDKTVMKSVFGSTLCRTLHECKACLQAFEGFKPL